MNYIVGLKNEFGLLNEQEAKKRYLELVSMGYSESDIIFAAPVSAKVDFNINQSVEDFSQNSNSLDSNDQSAYELPSDTPS